MVAHSVNPVSQKPPNIKLDGSDKPSEVDYFGRGPFIEAIVKTIESSKKGFNLGISARWGEGKSTILTQLQPKLEELNYRVLKFEPWKYTQDQISIKRKFLIDIHRQLGLEGSYDKAELYSNIEREKDLEKNEIDKMFKSRFGVFFKYSTICALIFLFVLCFLKFFVGLKFGWSERKPCKQLSHYEQSSNHFVHNELIVTSIFQAKKCSVP